MTTLATVQVGDYEGRGSEYLRKLYAALDRELPPGCRKMCITDDAKTLPPGVQAIGVGPGVKGWWAKLQLFKPGLFPSSGNPEDRVVYFDLDVIPVGDLCDLVVGYDGPFAAMSDPFFPESINTSVMSWKPSPATDAIWEVWDQGGRPQFDRRGDQYWVNQMMPNADRLSDLYPGQIVSFKVDCWLPGKIPDNARLMVFHGLPKPHDCGAGFVKRLWNRPLDSEEEAA